ncbi:MAG: hypothetical protein ACLFV6_02340 [Spirulinaceae cyanobacterium]
MNYQQPLSVQIRQFRVKGCKLVKASDRAGLGQLSQPQLNKGGEAIAGNKQAYTKVKIL